MSGASCLAPLQLADPHRHPWHEAADVVVVGFGGAGRAAHHAVSQRTAVEPASTSR